MSTITIVIPTYNESDNIADLLRDVADVLADTNCEIIVVDDDSPDRTWEIAEKVASGLRNVRVLRRTGVPRDHAQSVMDGFRISSGTIIGTLDADGSHDPRVLPILVRAIDNGADLAIGSRYIEGGEIFNWPLSRRLLSKSATAVARCILRLPICDPLSGFYLVRRNIYDRAFATAVPRGFKVLLELCVRGAPHTVVEIPIHFTNRTRGHSKLRATVICHAALSLLSLAIVQLPRPAAHRSRAV